MEPTYSLIDELGRPRVVAERFIKMIVKAPTSDGADRVETWDDEILWMGHGRRDWFNEQSFSYAGLVVMNFPNRLTTLRP